MRLDDRERWLDETDPDELDCLDSAATDDDMACPFCGEVWSRALDGPDCPRCGERGRSLT